MPLVRSVTLWLVITLLTTPAVAEPFRMSPKLTCFVPEVHGVGASVAKEVHANRRFITDVLGISDADAAELEVVYDSGQGEIDIVRRCDGHVVDNLANGFSADNAPGPIVNGKQKFGQTILVQPDATWGDFDTSGQIVCQTVKKLENGEVTAVSGTCIGALATLERFCQVQFKIGGAFEADGPCN